MKEIISRESTKLNELPRKIHYKNKPISEKHLIAESFNEFYAEVGKNLASKIPASKNHFSSYLSKCQSNMPFKALSIEELREAFQTLPSNKSPGIDKFSANIVKYVWDIIEPIILYIFGLSINDGTFPDPLKIAKVTPVYKSGDTFDVGNYRPISVLSCFSKILERIMYNRLYKHLLDQNILYKKQFGFQKNHSTDHAILELVSQITDSFEKNMYTIGVFIDLSKAFDTVDHEILISKLKNYGLSGPNLNWF